MFRDGGRPMLSRLWFGASRRHYLLGLLSALLGGLSLYLAATGGTATAQGRVFLLTPDEAAQLRLGPEDRASGPLLRSLPTGPRIIVREPPVRDTPDGSVIETTPLTRFVISFEQNRAPVDMQSLEVKARKGLFSVSLTPRLKPYVKGTNLEADTLSIPEGRFLVQIEIVDVAGARTLESYRLDVRRPGS
jgi:hypothetical protein